MIGKLIDRLWWMHHDLRPGYRGRHIGRPALVATPDHAGATADWSPTAEIQAVAATPVQAEETEPERAEREAAEIQDARHRAETQLGAEVGEWFAEAWTRVEPQFAALDEAYGWAMSTLGVTAAEAQVMSARARALHETTTGMPIIEVSA